MAATTLTNLVRAAAFLLGMTALAASCGGSAKPQPQTSTATPYPTPMPTTSGPSAEEIFNAPAPTGISTLTFVDRQHGWAIDTCPENTSNNITWCTILSTNDGGMTWHRRYRSAHVASLHRIRTLQFLDTQHGFAIGDDNTIVASNDGGMTWTPAYATAPSGMGGIRFVAPQIGFASASGVIFQLNDAGNAWVFNFGSPDCSFSSISLSQTGSVWAGGEGPGGPCLYRTKNLGKTWTASFAGIASPSVAGAISKSGFFGTRSSATPQIRPHCASGAPRFFSPSEARLFVACEMGSGITLTTTDGGKSWQYASEQGSCLAGCMTWMYQTGGGEPVFYLDLMHVWQCTAHQEISWSTDGGHTWNPVQSPALCCDANSIFFVDPDHGWIPFGESIARTTDGGRTWNRLPVTIQ